MGRRRKLTLEEQVTKTSLEVYLEYIQSDAPLSERAQLAAKVVSRGITQNHNLSGSVDVQVMGRIVLDGKDFVPNIGEPANG